MASYVENVYLLSLSNLHWERLIPKTEGRKKWKEEGEEEEGGRVSLDHTFASDMGVPARRFHTMVARYLPAEEKKVRGRREGGREGGRQAGR